MTHKSKIQPHINHLKSDGYIHKQHRQLQIYTKPRTPPITKHNYTERYTRVIISHSAQQIPNFLITHKITILLHNYVQKERNKRQKRKEKRVGTIILG